MKSVVLAILCAAAGFAIGALSAPVGQGGPVAVWDAFRTFDGYPAMLEQGWLTNPIVGAVVGAALGAILGRPRRE